MNGATLQSGLSGKDAGTSLPLAVAVSTPFFYLRHGTTDHNAQRLITGHVDVPLNEAGRQQAEDAAQRLVRCGIARIVSSPLLRARETADIVAGVLNVAVEVNPNFRERDWGSLSGRSLRELPRGGPLPDGVEPLDLFIHRTVSALLPLLQGPPLLLVGHSGHCRALRRVFLHNHDGEGAVPNGVPLCFTPTPSGLWRELSGRGTTWPPVRRYNSSGGTAHHQSPTAPYSAGGRRR